MKKALVLGVMAFFAINIATVQNVNAQDKKNVQPTNEAVNATMPAQQNKGGKLSTDKTMNTTKGATTTTTTTTTTTKASNGNKVDKKASKEMQNQTKTTDPKVNTVETTDKKASNGKKVDTKVAKDVQNKNVAGKDKTSGKEATVEKDNTKKDTKKESKSVPPTPKEKQKVTGNTNNTQR